MGSMVFNEIVWEKTRTLSERLPDILGLAISFGKYLIPSEKMHGICCKMEEEIVSEIEYDDIRKNFLFVKNVKTI